MTGDPGTAEPSPAPSAPSGDDAPDLWDRTAVWLLHHGALPVLGAVTLIMVVLYAHVFDGEILGDDLTFHMAESARIADCLRTGDFDLWNPSGNAGFASAYYYQAVPQLISAIPTAVFGHHLFFFQLSVFLPLVLAPAAAYRGMRLLGATPWQAALAALAVGFINGESRWGTGNAGTFSVGLYTQTWAFAAFPLALGHAVRWATEGKGLAPAIAWGTFMTLCHPIAGIALAVALLAGVVAQLVLRGVDWLLFEIAQGILPEQVAGGDVTAAVIALGERWRHPPQRPWLRELVRTAILGGCFGIAWMPIWAPLLIDYAGFGAFPHRVGDEVGPGFVDLARWFAFGAIFDYQRPMVLTWSLPAVIVFARARFLRWLWAPAVVYAVWLGLGPHIGKTHDDLIPAVRMLGALQVVAALAIGAGALMIGARLWNAPEGSPLARAGRVACMGAGLVGVIAIAYSILFASEGSAPLALGEQLTLHLLSQSQVRAILVCLIAVVVGLWARTVWRALRSQYGLRTGLAAIAAALAVLLMLPGSRALDARVRVLDDYPGNHSAELRTIAWVLRYQPPGRKQVGKGAENHWWNLLTYEYGRRPSLLMMGGGGLQASPNYDFLWTVKDFTKMAWVYDAPILVFDRANVDKMPAGEDVFGTTNILVRRLPAPGLVSPVEVTGVLPPGRDAARAAAIAWLKTDEPLADHVLGYHGHGGLSGAPHGKVVRAVRQDSPGDAADIRAEVDATERTTFMARESWHPRWRAYIDGAPAPVRRVTPDFPAVDVQPGHHVVEFRFERPWWANAAWLAWPAVPLAAWLISRRRRRTVMAS
ncbi:MAG TPA: hypothetical protein VFD36_08335 [Kofleriaceae bacterium]|nr:hypothetical protein [Kofleriaceae bacterium]